MRLRLGSGRAQTAEGTDAQQYPPRDMAGAPSLGMRKAPMSSGTQGTGGMSPMGSRGSMGTGGLPSPRPASRDARFQSAGRPLVRSLRTAGHAKPNAGLVKGSPTRILNEIVGAEREASPSATALHRALTETAMLLEV